MNTIKSRNACKAVKPATAWRESNSSRDNRNITASTAEGRPATTRMPEIVKTSIQLTQQGRQQHNKVANSTIWMPTSFSQKFASQKNDEKLLKSDLNKMSDILQ